MNVIICNTLILWHLRVRVTALIRARGKYNAHWNATTFGREAMCCSSVNLTDVVRRRLMCELKEIALLTNAGVT